MAVVISTALAPSRFKPVFSYLYHTYIFCAQVRRKGRGKGKIQAFQEAWFTTPPLPIWLAASLIIGSGNGSDGSKSDQHVIYPAAMMAFIPPGSRHHIVCHGARVVIHLQS